MAVLVCNRTEILCNIVKSYKIYNNIIILFLPKERPIKLCQFTIDWRQFLIIFWVVIFLYLATFVFWTEKNNFMWLEWPIEFWNAPFRKPMRDPNALYHSQPRPIPADSRKIFVNKNCYWTPLWCMKKICIFPYLYE